MVFCFQICNVIVIKKKFPLLLYIIGYAKLKYLEYCLFTVIIYQYKKYVKK